MMSLKNGPYSNTPVRSNNLTLPNTLNKYIIIEGAKWRCYVN